MQRKSQESVHTRNGIFIFIFMWLDFLNECICFRCEHVYTVHDSLSLSGASKATPVQWRGLWLQ